MRVKAFEASSAEALTHQVNLHLRDLICRWDVIQVQYRVVVRDDMIVKHCAMVTWPMPMEMPYMMGMGGEG